ncbi:three-helix bundle dimerization domain-containing protein [Streptomyces inhibens]|uniref:three-helix bundle dimerization domain-containing protein n=1 Tax=Streptomyces inhibens TaxID=2293571 RepID=UPI0036C931A7
MTARLKAAFPMAAPATVEELVGAASQELSHARVRTYIAILVERRARKALAANDTVTEAVTAQQPSTDAVTMATARPALPPKR